MMEPPNGSSRTAHSRSGTQQDHCYGFMGSVCLFRIPIHRFLMLSGHTNLQRDPESLFFGTCRKSVDFQRVHVFN
jgi:hypothetical protein